MKTIMIDRTIKNIKKTLILWREYLQQKYQEKILYKVLEGILTAKIANIKKNFFFVFPTYKRAKYKT